jgi:membrane-bound inhibitor of C-type lysozyme/uncharacterized membrane protein
MRRCWKWLYCAMICVTLPACGAFDLRHVFSDQDEKESAGFQPEERPLATTLVYDCDGFEFVARLGAGEMALWLPDQYVVLSQARSASGTLYEEGDISFWSKGDDAMLTIGAQQYLNCQLQPRRAPWEDARRRGVVFRAVGNAVVEDSETAPGWQLEISRERQLLFATDYGMQRIVVQDSGGQQDNATGVYEGRTDAHTLKVDIRNQECVDSLNAEVLPAQVVVTLDATAYRGCGRYLAYPWQDLE